MRVSYRETKRTELGVAVIEYDGKKEQVLIEKMCILLNMRGWHHIECSGKSLCIIRLDSVENYRGFVNDYKKVKKKIKFMARMHL